MLQLGVDIDLQACPTMANWPMQLECDTEYHQECIAERGECHTSTCITSLCKGQMHVNMCLSQHVVN